MKSTTDKFWEAFLGIWLVVGTGLVVVVILFLVQIVYLLATGHGCD